MTFKPGEINNPNGSVARYEFTRELKVILNEPHGKTKRRKLTAIANKLADCALEGQAWAIQEVANRLEGKAIQPVAGSIEVSATSLFIEVLKRISQGHFVDEKTIEHQATE